MRSVAAGDRVALHFEGAEPLEQALERFRTELPGYCDRMLGAMQPPPAFTRTSFSRSLLAR